MSEVQNVWPRSDICASLQGLQLHQEPQGDCCCDVELIETELNWGDLKSEEGHRQEHEQNQNDEKALNPPLWAPNQ